MRSGAVVTLLLALAAAPCLAAFTPSVVEPSAPSLVRSANGSSLYAVTAAGYSDGPFLVADIRGETYYDWGYSYGSLLANESVANFEALYQSTVGSSKLFRGLLSAFLDSQWDRYLSKGVPQQFVEELQGVEDAGVAVGVPQLGTLVRRGLTLGNVATGSVVGDILWVIIHEAFGAGEAVREHAGPGQPAEEIAAEFARLTRGLFGRHCSMWGAWGSRTTGGQLLSGRNLDWDAQTGVSKNKVLAVYHPPSGGTGSPYVVVGFAGLVGALTGFSRSGVTVHEAGDDNTRETLSGTAWMLRLRLLMEHATSLDDARSMWEATENTLGINHGVGFGGPQERKERFMAIETCANYSAYFYDNDARESASPYGQPAAEVVYRTNHGYDPEFLKTAMYNVSALPGSDSEVRYRLLANTFVQYEGHDLTELQAVNLTAIDGDKGPRYSKTAAPFLDCSRKHAMYGSNVLSVTFSPSPATPVMWVAVEDGSGADYVPAACGNYVKFDMTKWFA